MSNESPIKQPIKPRVIDTKSAVFILLLTVGCVFGVGTVFSVQYESNCTSNPKTGEASCTERRAWDSSGAVQALSTIVGAGAGGAAAIWKAGGLPKFIENFLGGGGGE